MKPNVIAFAPRWWLQIAFGLQGQTDGDRHAMYRWRKERAVPAPRKMMVQTCPTCGNQFYNRPRQKHCSRSCGAVGKRTGADNTNYNYGLCRHRGRWLITCKDGTTVPYARAVIAAHVGRLPQSDEIVHHVNEDPSDDRLENLALVTRAEHVGLHREGLLAARLAKQGR